MLRRTERRALTTDSGQNGLASSVPQSRTSSRLLASSSSLPSLLQHGVQPPLAVAKPRSASRAALPQPGPVAGQRRASSATRVNPRAAYTPSRGCSKGAECKGFYAPSCQGQAGENDGASPGVVLFLDVDGVLHPSHCRFPRQQFKPSCMQLLREVLQASGAEIVLSTAWRLHEEARTVLAQQLEEHGLPGFVGRTANIDTFHRSREILAWVRKHRPSSWVAVDDWPLGEETDEMTGHFVNSRPRYGLQPETAQQIIALFREQGVEIASPP